MSFIGTMLKNRRAGEAGLAWNLLALAGPETLGLASPAFTDGAPIPAEHAGTRVGGRETSPPLSWSAAPEGTAELLLVMEDVDVPMRRAPRPRAPPRAPCSPPSVARPSPGPG